MSDIDVAALRAAAEGATLPMTCGGHRSMGSVIRCEECTTRADAMDDLSDATSPAVVLELLDRLAAAEGAVEEVRRAFDPGELDCGRLGMTCRDVHTPDRWCRACRITNALDPKEQP